MKALKPLLISGREVLPLVEGGKGISVSNGESSGAWAAAGGIGTFSGVNADSFDDNGNVVEQVYRGKTRRERHEELIGYSIAGGITQARIAPRGSRRPRPHPHECPVGDGGAERILHGILEGSKGLIHGVTCGAGMPYKVAEIAASYGIHYYPIVSSARAFRALWKRAYHKFSDISAAWSTKTRGWPAATTACPTARTRRAGGPVPPRAGAPPDDEQFGLETTPIVMAGGVWYLREWEEWIDNPDLGPIAFQYGTRPLLTQESPISDAWKRSS